MFRHFTFESTFYPTLSRVPVYVRMKLDLTGIKISLDQWLAFSLEERHVLCHLPAEAPDEHQVFIAYLDYLSLKYCGRPAVKTAPTSSAAWDTLQLPPPVVQKSSMTSQPVDAAEWMRWEPFERYALYKTAISKNEPEAFVAVLNELRAACQK